MNCEQCIEAIDEHVDGETPPGVAAELESHVASCPACREQLRALRALRTATAGLPREVRPARDLWPEISAQLGPRPVTATVSRGGNLFFFPPRWMAAAAALAILAGGTVVWLRIANAPAFTVTRIEGAPQVAGKSVANESRLRVGQWLETDASSSARVEVAMIGSVTVQPNSRLRLVATSPTEHRLELSRGGLEAVVKAPPRLFIVDTPAATAIDLGCAYTIAVDDRGGGLLHVTSGYVALARNDREEIVRAGMMCAMRPGVGAGTPFAEDAPAGLRAALDRLDFESPTALPEVLAQARPRDDALTLWHLLSRVSAGQRGTVYDALAGVDAPPVGVTREGIIAGDPAMLAQWERFLLASRGLGLVPLMKKA